MESDDLKSSPPDDALETWLRTNATLPPLADDGFSRRVLAALPAPAPRRRPWRSLVLVAGALAGLLLAARPFFSGHGPVDALPELDATLLAAINQLATPAVALAAVVTAASLAIVFWSDLRRFVRL